MITTQKFTPWVVVKDKLGYLNIHEQPEEGAPSTGDLIAQTYGDEQHAYRMAAANELYEALDRLVIFHQPSHPLHDALHEDYAEECIANEISFSSATLLDSLVRAARAALAKSGEAA